MVLFDELEKAHEQVVHLLLQLLEDGRLTDSHVSADTSSGSRQWLGEARLPTLLIFWNLGQVVRNLWSLDSSR